MTDQKPQRQQRQQARQNATYNETHEGMPHLEPRATQKATLVSLMEVLFLGVYCSMYVDASLNTKPGSERVSSILPNNGGDFVGGRGIEGGRFIRRGGDPGTNGHDSRKCAQVPGEPVEEAQTDKGSSSYAGRNGTVLHSYVNSYAELLLHFKDLPGSFGGRDILCCCLERDARNRRQKFFRCSGFHQLR